MDYVPDELLRRRVAECALGDASKIVHPAIVRRLPVEASEVQNDLLLLRTAYLPFPLSIRCDATMTFGTEATSAAKYFRRVIEPGDMIDALVLPRMEDRIPIELYWIHIQYVGDPLAAGSYSKKDDGLFAMRGKAGEKAERVVTKLLRDKFRHSFPAGMCDSPGYFEIRYEKKKHRKPDRKCLTCGLVIEIKKRNKDGHLRVSHSASRPFASENPLPGWHAFVFPDMRPRFVSNAAIAEAISEGKFEPGEDCYDKWADVDSLTPRDPPYCTC